MSRADIIVEKNSSRAMDIDSVIITGTGLLELYCSVMDFVSKKARLDHAASQTKDKCWGDIFSGLKSSVESASMHVNVDEVASQIAFAGDHVTMTLTGADVNSVNVGYVMCDPASPTKCAVRIRAKVVIFNLEVPITRGFPVVFHYQCINEPAVIKRLVSSLNKSTGEVVKTKPKCLTKNSSAVVEIEFERTVCVELYSEYRDLGRFMLRQGGNTIAAGLIEEVSSSDGRSGQRAAARTTQLEDKRSGSKLRLFPHQSSNLRVPHHKSANT